MEGIVDTVILLAIAVVGAALARRLGFVAPLVLLVAGLGLSFVPGLPGHPPGPELVLIGILPPLLYVAALQTSVPAFRQPAADPAARGRAGAVHRVRRRLRACTLLLPAVPFAVCFALGAVVAPPDAVSATAIARRIGLPRRMVTILEGESLINDATALVLLRVAGRRATGGAVGFWRRSPRRCVAQGRRRHADRRWLGAVVVGWLHKQDPATRCWTTRSRCSRRSWW